MIEDARVLREEFVPHDVVHRDGEVDALSAVLRETALDVETLVYRVDEGVHQTTITYWAEILRARHPSIASGGSVAASRTGSSVSTPSIGPGEIR